MKFIEFKHLLKEIYCSLKIYKLKPNKLTNQIFICMNDGLFLQGGMTDRFKGIISLYAYCKQRNVTFKIYHTSPYRLTDYLLPNTYNWIVEEGAINYNLFQTRMLYNFGEYTGSRLLKLKTKRQLHYYGNRDLLDVINKSKNTNFRWGDLFHELFDESPQMKIDIAKHIDILGSQYYAVVFRFQQLLGDFQEYNFPTLDNQERDLLVKKCIVALEEIKSKHVNSKILVTSDSVTFLDAVKNKPNIYIIPGKVVHVDITKNEPYEVYLKSFLDFFLISKSSKIYSIGTSQMYQTEFPLYASRVNDIPFERILI